MENATHSEPRIRETLRNKARQFAELRRGIKRRLGILAPLRIVRSLLRLLRRAGRYFAAP